MTETEIRAATLRMRGHNKVIARYKADMAAARCAWHAEQDSLQQEFEAKSNIIRSRLRVWESRAELIRTVGLLVLEDEYENALKATLLLPEKTITRP